MSESYVYQQSESRLWTVGFYTPDGDWVSEADFDSADAAAERVHWLNGGYAYEDDYPEEDEYLYGDAVYDLTHEDEWREWDERMEPGYDPGPDWSDY